MPELNHRHKKGANIIGLRDKNKEYTVNPPADTRLSPDDQLFVLGTDEELESLRELMKKGV